MGNPKKKVSLEEEVISLDRLAELSGLTISELRIGGSAFFRRLGTMRAKLMGATVAASSASGANPKKFIDMLSNLADELETEDFVDDKLVRLDDHRR